MARGARVTARTHNRDDDCELSDSDDDGGAPHFPAVEKAIDEAITAVGGCAFVKLNWSAPKDAAWLGTLECATAGDAFALLAASSLLKDDAARALNVVLAVRRFVSVEPSREFRCFLLDGRLVAACQRRACSVSLVVRVVTIPTQASTRSSATLVMNPR